MHIIVQYGERACAQCCATALQPQARTPLARATREISIITQRGLAALLLSAEPRPAMV